MSESLFGEKKLGFGLMRLPLKDVNDSGSIDTEEMCRMVDMFLDRGFTYFDTAWMYCDYKSENAVKTCITDRHQRDKYTITTKLHAGYLKTEDDRDRIFNTQLEKTGAGYFDYYLLHDMGRRNFEVYERLNCFEWIAEKKRRGEIRHMGFSFHDNADFLDEVLTKHPEMEFVQLQINYLDWENAGIQSHKCHDVAAKHGKPVIVMEPVKGGTLANVPAGVQKLYRDYNPDASIPSWAIRFAASQPQVKLVLSGMSNMQQLDDNTSYMQDFKPLSEEELSLIWKAVNIINEGVAIPCTACSYCTDGCPMNIPIPKYFSLYNAELQEIPDKDFTVQSNYYERLTQTFGAADACIECGQCENICPQHLPIRKYLKDVAKMFG